jgi:hypothetical protein
LEVPTTDVSSKVFYGEGYDDSDRRIPDMTIINKQLGKFYYHHLFCLDLYAMPEIRLMDSTLSIRLESKDIAVGFTGLNIDISAQDLC